MKFFIVDAFTEELFGGNPAGVVLVDGVAFPSDETMLKTAAELRYSETAFVRSLGGNRFQTRYFTPAAEVELCGHATVGAFAAMKYAGVVKTGAVCKNKTLAGELNVEVSEDSILMDMGTPAFIGGIDEPRALKELYGVMGLTYREGGSLLPELVSTGLPDIILPVRDESELEEIAPDFCALSALSQKYNVVGVHAFAANTADGCVHCRNFAPLYAIDEEAATGTANGALTYYLYRNGLLSSPAEVVFIQGEKMNRPSKIIGRLDSPELVRVGGSAAVLACGDIMI